MAYESQIEMIWEKLKYEGSERRPTSFRTTFDNVCSSFFQAETGPEFPVPSEDLRKYRAEWNIWAYYFGEQTPFPGMLPSKPPSSSLQTLPLVNNSHAAETHTHLENLWARSVHRQGYKPQLGLNPDTGEPWLAIRCYAYNAYPAFSGEGQRYLAYLHKAIKHFVIQYERFRTEGYLLIWPEFRKPTELNDDQRWREFNVLRNFLAKWADMRAVQHIHVAYSVFCSLPESEKQPLPFPEGFYFDYNSIKNLSVSIGASRVLPSTSSSKRDRSESDLGHSRRESMSSKFSGRQTFGSGRDHHGNEPKRNGRGGRGRKRYNDWTSQQDNPNLASLAPRKWGNNVKEIIAGSKYSPRARTPCYNSSVEDDYRGNYTPFRSNKWGDDADKTFDGGIGPQNVSSPKYQPYVTHGLGSDVSLEEVSHHLDHQDEREEKQNGEPVRRNKHTRTRRGKGRLSRGAK